MTGRAGETVQLRSPRPVLMLLVTASWGACFVAIRYGLRDAPVLWFAALRSMVAGAALLAVGYAFRRPTPPVSYWPGIAVLGMVNVTLAFAAMFAGTARVGSAVAAVLANAQPVLIVLPAWALYREPPKPHVLAGLVVAFGGLAIVASPGGVGSDGAWLSLASAAAVTAGTLLARRLGKIDAVMVSAGQLLIGGGVLAAWAATEEGAPAIAWTPGFLASLFFLALVGTAASYVIWFHELQRTPLVSLSAWTILTPVFGVGLGWLLLADRPTAAQAIGIGLVLGALAILGPHRRPTDPFAVRARRSIDHTDLHHLTTLVTPISPTFAACARSGKDQTNQPSQSPHPTPNLGDHHA